MLTLNGPQIIPSICLPLNASHGTIVHSCISFIHVGYELESTRNSTTHFQWREPGNLHSNDCVLLLLFCSKTPLHSRRVAMALLCFCGCCWGIVVGTWDVHLHVIWLGLLSTSTKILLCQEFLTWRYSFPHWHLKCAPWRNDPPTKEGHYFWCIPLWLASCCYRRPCCFADGIKSLYKLSQTHLNCNEVHVH